MVSFSFLTYFFTAIMTNKLILKEEIDMLVAIKANDELVKEQANNYLDGNDELYNIVFDSISSMSKEELGEYVKAVIYAAATVCVNNDWNPSELYEDLGYQSQEINFN